MEVEQETKRRRGPRQDQQAAPQSCLLGHLLQVPTVPEMSQRNPLYLVQPSVIYKSRSFASS